MSCSKHQVRGVADKAPKCARCRHHGYVVPQKGHTRSCPLLDCTCWKCSLVTERSKIGALQRKVRNSEKMNPGAGGTEPQTPMGKGEAESPGTSSQTQSSSATIRVVEDEVTADKKTYAQLRTVPPPEMMMDPSEEARFSGRSRIHFLQRGASPNPPHVASPNPDPYRDHQEARSSVIIRTQQQDGLVQEMMNRTHLQVPNYFRALGQREAAFHPVAMPMVVWGRCPNGCTPFPGILVNMPPHPCPHGPFYMYTPASPDGSGLFFPTQPSAAYPAPYHPSDHFQIQ